MQLSSHAGEIVVEGAAVVLKVPQVLQDLGQDRSSSSCSSGE
jgi:hypothetical protein